MRVISAVIQARLHAARRGWWHRGPIVRGMRVSRHGSYSSLGDS